ncbi:peptide/nickel transport system substrate-binding protein [Evansella caseinilytica]|uniref:Peptide/nickel transport system substrate-binding protein n=1 Tax=Evansella caseinilytica TaxID=1503961 RepID=A0A1H3HK84_9BACI|nr:ABC transporter substrate-binding protein [Evansella caseinilytica]SDY15852.1 peptide/nickel transport system substrate-binding protein [Evansella caseinilytica]
MKNWISRTGLLLATVSLLFIIGCSEPASPDTESKEGDGSENSQEDAVDGGELIVGLSANPMTLDPVSYTSTYESQVIRSIADTLVIYSNDLMEIEPALATEWEVSDDLMTYTFKLREDAFFQPGEYQDGRQMTAEDVKFSLERSANDSAMNRLRMVESVEVVEEFTVNVHLSEPNSALLAVLTDAGNVIVPQEEVEGWGDQFGMNLVGTGPFKLDEWKIDDQIQLSRHDNYWSQTPHLDTLIWKGITDQNMMVNALRSGDIDIATDIQGQNRAILEQEEGFELLTVPGLSIEYVAMNMMEGPTADIRVREAINLATNVDELVQGVFQYGGAIRSYLPLPQSSWGYEPSLESMVPDFDPERAKQLLAEAGYPDGFEIDLYVIERRVPHATIFQSQLKENLNIDVNVNVVEFGVQSDIASQGQAPMYLMGWSWYPDPDFFLYQMFHSDQIGSLGNGYGFHHPEVDELIERATAETVDQEERRDLYVEAMELIIQEYPRVELSLVEITAGISDQVNGFDVRPDNSFIIVNPNTNVSVSQ